MDERVLAERLIMYDTSKPEVMRAAAAFVKGWLEARDIDVHDRDFDGLPVVMADVGAREGPDAMPARFPAVALRRRSWCCSSSGCAEKERDLPAEERGNDRRA
jgi:hypothetical protein